MIALIVLVGSGVLLAIGTGLHIAAAIGRDRQRRSR